MALEDIPEMTEQRVVDTIRFLWNASGAECQVVDWPEIERAAGVEDSDELSGILAAVLVPAHDLIECLVLSTADLARASRHVKAIMGRGWSVNVLTEYSHLGAAHEQFRGLGVTVQGWRMNADSPSFSPVEIA